MKLKRLVPQPTRRASRAAWNDYRLKRAVRELKLAPPGTLPTDSLLTRLRDGWGNLDWSGDVAYLRAVCEHATAGRGPILECGSGLTTIVLSALVGEQKESISLEHLSEWCERVERVLSRHDLPNRLRHMPLTHRAGFDWYASDFLSRDQRFGLVICDGPPGSTLGGRYGLLPVCRDHLAPDCVILLDDAERPEERDMLERWRREFGIAYRVESTPLGDYAVATRREPAMGAGTG
jgi:Methyltransferase domain